LKRLWLFCFPLLFLPNVGLSHQSAFGVLEVSDWLIVPFIALLLVAPSAKYNQQVSRVNPLLWGFLAWALLSIISIPFRYQYVDDVPILIGSGLKLARLVLYAAASIIISSKLSDPTVRKQWLWSLLAALLIVSIGLLTSRGDSNAQPSEALEGYKSYNSIIVSIAILSIYTAGLWIDNIGGRKWNRCACIVVVVAVCSVLSSTSLTTHGRGGWVAFAAGFGYILWARTQNLKILAIVTVVGLASLTAYDTLPTFKSLVDLTFSPSDLSTPLSVDDGDRVSTWVHEAPKLVDAPVLGTGFYHRGGASPLWSSGSHNFFIQMFLETGVVGGILVILIFALAWQLSGLSTSNRTRITLATRAAVTTAIVGGMSGEYYYGGIGVLTLFATFAIVGSLPTARTVLAIDSADAQPALCRLAQ
jgi:O-antigen ligase